jgi:hypothetical protein
MASKIPHVAEVDAVGGYSLRLTFDDGFTGDVDLSGLPDKGPVFSPLRDPEFFAKASVDPQTRTVTWPGGIDLDPESLREEAERHPANSRTRSSWIGYVAAAAVGILIGRRLRIPARSLHSAKCCTLLMQRMPSSRNNRPIRASRRCEVCGKHTGSVPSWGSDLSVG